MGTGESRAETKTAKTDELKAIVEPLRLGHGLLSREQFLQMLMDGTFEIWRLPHNCYALISWGESEHGKTCNIMTGCGVITPESVDAGIKAIDRIARERGARVVISVGRPGYAKAAKANGYHVERCIIMRKVLES